MAHRFAAWMAVVVSTLPLRAAAANELPLPAPAKRGAVSVEAALATRRSVRAFSKQPLTLAELSQLLWAAQGISGPDGRRTAPSARRTYPLELAVVVRRVAGVAAGAYRYVPGRHALSPLAPAAVGEDLLASATDQKHVLDAPAVFVVAAVYERIGEGPGSPTGVDFEAGAAGENLPLQAVALGLGACVVGGFDAEKAKGAVGFSGQEAPVVLIPVGRGGG